MDYKQKVYKVVKKIPKGKVSTYGNISKKIGSITPRMVGQALHTNPDPDHIPCHRIVNRDGKVAEHFAFGGWREQGRRLINEGVGFIDPIHVDLGRHLWLPKK